MKVSDTNIQKQVDHNIVIVNSKRELIRLAGRTPSKDRVINEDLWTIEDVKKLSFNTFKILLDAWNCYNTIDLVHTLNTHKVKKLNLYFI